MRARIPVVEIMTQTPVTIHGDATAKAAAGLMREKDIGSLVVVDTGKPMGIVTERDLVTKVAAEDKQPSRVLVRDIMTSPVVAVHPHEEVAEAAKLMAERKIRRLPVVKEGKLIGIVTENDILRIWPQLIEVTRESARAGLESQFAKGIEGHCEACGVYSTNLVWDRNLLVCPECRGG
ncbi:MAG: CBS domain-containing protein [Methanobacteriota archaeon]|nr:MAG: CBS domain-containing protein [Euryarchaeota archaeon]TLZ80795.1 MAG: CBS domain-containing protein [Euryarchaeota archaeon]